ncbi:hypothetical protein [Streptomyces sp. NPDC096339]|uniref:hypothetical protein n=1 Tax=Streptomyces sp. NPDC096339 TaxID=3366086 RepID=UPI0038045ABF
MLFGLRAATRLLTLAAQVNRYSVLGTAAEGGAADTAAWQAYTMALGPALPAMAVTAAVFISNRLADGSTTVAGVRDAALASAASDLLFVVAAALAVVLVRRISAMQEA